MGATVSRFLNQTISPRIEHLNSLSKLGIKLSYVLLLFDDIEYGHLTTNDICEKFIKPVTEKYQCSFCEYLQCIDEDLVGEAQAFISHAWLYKFKDVLSALKLYFADNLDVFIWFDLATINQHQILNVCFDWRCFNSVIKEIGKTVMVLAPWNQPFPLARAWCIWELYCTIATNTIFDIALNEGCEIQFVTDIDKGPNLVVNAMIGAINCEKSECTSLDDKARIHKAIIDNVGFRELDKLVLDKMREWIIAQYAKEMKKRREELGPDNAKTLSAMQNLALLYENQGNYQDAEPLLLECYERNRSKYGETHHETLNSMDSLGHLYYQQGNYPAAEPLLNQCFELRRLHLGLDHVDTLQSMHNLGKFYFRDLEKAELILSECVGKRKLILGEDDVDTLESMVLLAQVYDSQGKYDLSLPLQRQVLQQRRVKLGTEHPSTLDSMHSLAGVYMQQKEYYLSESLFYECLEARKSKLGITHPDTQKTMNNLALLYTEHKKYHEAEPLYLQSYQEFTTTLGPDHPLTLFSLGNLAVFYESCGKLQLSEKYYLECFVRRTEKLGPDHIDTLAFLDSLTCFYQKQSKYKETEACYQRALTLRRAKLGNMHPDTLKSMNYLASFYSHHCFPSRYDLAEPLLVECLTSLQSILGLTHEVTIKTMDQLADLYRDSQQQELAENLYLRCINLLKQAPDSKSNIFLETMEKLAYLYESQKKYESAELLLNECLERKRALLGPGHEETIHLARSLLSMYRDQGKKDHEYYQVLLKELPQANPDVSTCPNQHQMPKDICSRKGFTCDRCFTQIQPGEVIFHCGLCNYDLCEFCS